MVPLIYLYIQKFTPSFFLPNGHWQTIMNPIQGARLKKKSPITYDRELFKFSDGGTIALDWTD